MRSLLALAATTLVLVACGGSVPPPNDQFAATEKNVGRAQEGGAANVPDAKLHLQLAQENLEQAKGFMAKDTKRAASLISRADAEAELALQIAREATLQGEAAQAHAQLNNPSAPAAAPVVDSTSVTSTTTTTSATVGKTK